MRLKVAYNFRRQSKIYALPVNLGRSSDDAVYWRILGLPNRRTGFDTRAEGARWVDDYLGPHFLAIRAAIAGIGDPPADLAGIVA